MNLFSVIDFLFRYINTPIKMVIISIRNLTILILIYPYPYFLEHCTINYNKLRFATLIMTYYFNNTWFIHLVGTQKFMKK